MWGRVAQRLIRAPKIGREKSGSVIINLMCSETSICNLKGKGVVMERAFRASGQEDGGDPGDLCLLR